MNYDVATGQEIEPTWIYRHDLETGERIPLAKPEKGGYSLEPFLYIGGRLLTWNDIQAAPSLARGWLPIPSVRWPDLMITAYAAGGPEQSTLYVDYVLQSAQALNATLFIAVRPFQVNPPWQFLGVTGGTSTIHDIRYQNHVVEIDNRQPVVSIQTLADLRGAKLSEPRVTTALLASFAVLALVWTVFGAAAFFEKRPPRWGPRTEEIQNTPKEPQQ